jgi:hypothetical protein
MSDKRDRQDYLNIPPYALTCPHMVRTKRPKKRGKTMMNFVEMNMMVLSLIITNFNNKPIRLKVERYGSHIDRKYRNYSFFTKTVDYNIRDNKKIKAIVLALCGNELFQTQVYNLSDCIAITFEKQSHKERMSQYAQYTLFINK